MKPATDGFKEALPGTFNYGLDKGLYVDPLGISKSASEDSIKLWREAEITHGRVSMLSFVHAMVTEVCGFHPLLPDNTGITITHVTNTPPEVLAAMGTCIGALEFARAKTGWLEPTQPENLWTLRDTYTPGDLGFDPLNLNKGTDAEKRTRVDKELNNGRLAALAVAGIVAQELATQQPISTVFN